MSDEGKSVRWESDWMQDGFTMLPNAVMKLELEGSELLLYVSLCFYAGQDETCWPGQARLAKQMGMSESTVRRALRGLEDRGLVETARRGMGKTNVYTLKVLTGQSDRSRPVKTGVIGHSDRPDRSQGPGNNKRGTRHVGTQGDLGLEEVGGECRGGEGDGYPAAVKVALPEVHRRLAGLASRKRITVPKQESLAKAMAAYPDRDFVAVADELVFWAEDGHGSQRKIKVLAGTYRNFLKHSSPDPMAVARELDALDGAIDSTAVEL